jgi:hypothetical protein
VLRASSRHRHHHRRTRRRRPRWPPEQQARLRSKGFCARVAFETPFLANRNLNDLKNDHQRQLFPRASSSQDEATLAKFLQRPSASCPARAVSSVFRLPARPVRRAAHRLDRARPGSTCRRPPRPPRGWGAPWTLRYPEKSVQSRSRLRMEAPTSASSAAWRSSAAARVSSSLAAR